MKMLNGKLNLGIPNIGIYNLFAENLIGKLHDKNKKIIIKQYDYITKVIY